MKKDVDNIIKDAYNVLISTYKSTFTPAHAVNERSWLYDAFPKLKRNKSLNRALYDMNVNSYQQPANTGICLTIALFLKCYLKDVHNIESEMIGLFNWLDSGFMAPEHRRKQFCHCVLKVQDKYYDTFWPNGTDIENIMFYDDCFIDDVKDTMSGMKSNDGYQFLYNKYYLVVKSKLYNPESSDMIHKEYMSFSQ